MKKLFTIAAALFLTASTWAQSPEKMSYQAVIRDASNDLVVNSTIGMQISILQSTPSGLSVFIEKHTPTTNANGLATVEIGEGSLVAGSFAGIDWADGPYFIKTETDPNGGTVYTISGTTQLMSVPYALHAKTAESVTGPINFTETDPTFTAWDKSTGITITESQISDLTHTVDTDTQLSEAEVDAFVANNGYLTSEVDGSLTNEIQTINRVGTTVTLSNGGGSFTDSVNTYTAGANITIDGNNVISATTGSSLAIGDSYQGGIIFWLDESGEHGLIAATADQSTGVQWYNGANKLVGVTGDGLHAGEMNTALIVAGQISDNQSGSFAAKVCADYQVVVNGVTYGDWYLPSAYELTLLYEQSAAVGNFLTTPHYSSTYWSSTEFQSSGAKFVYFSSGSTDYYYKDNLYRVRAIRSF